MSEVLNLTGFIRDVKYTACLTESLDRVCLEQFDVNESILKSLEARKPGSVHYLERGKREPGTLLSRWNLVVPNSILKREWEEPNENF